MRRSPRVTSSNPYWLAALLSLAAAAATYAATASLPFFSESYTHLEATARLGSVFDCFDPALVPLRPFQHAYFYLLQVFGLDQPALARVFPFALHAIAGVLVATLARQLGCSPRIALFACALFLTFPNVKGLVWVAAISGPGRVVCALAGLCCIVRHRTAPAWWSGPGALAALLGGLAFHQSAFLWSGFYVLLAAALDDSPRGFPARVGRALRDPWLATAVAVTVVYLVYLVFLRPERHHRVGGDSAAIVANSAKALLAMLPEFLRVPALDGLRGLGGTAGRVVGFGACALVAAGLAMAAWRGTRVQRALLLAILADLALPAATTGFVVRYCYLAAALAACGLLLAVERRRPASGTGRAGILAIGLIAAAWTFDTVVDVREYRNAGAETERILDRVGEVRQRVGPDRPILLVDFPDIWGRERDIPLFNWGVRQALERRGVPGTWLPRRTVRFHSSTDFVPITPGALAETREPTVTYDRTERRVHVELR